MGKGMEELEGCSREGEGVGGRVSGLRGIRRHYK